MSSISTDSADNVRSEVTLLGTIVLSVTNLTTVLAGLILVVAKSTVKSSKLTQLIALELILSFWDGCSGFNNIVDQLLGFVDLLLGICHDQTMKILLLVASVSGIRTAFSFLNGSLSTDSDFGLRFSFHFLERVSTRSDK
jgi:hypothetical protein